MTSIDPDVNTETTSPAVGVKELGHIVLYVANIERSANFYRDVLGWRQITPPASAGRLPVAIFSSGRTHHELLLIEVGEDAAPIPTGRRIGMYHFGLKVGDTDSDLVEMARRVREAGAVIVGASDHGITHSLYIEDPDGNEIELYVDVPGVDWSDFATIAQAPKPLRLQL